MDSTQRRIRQTQLACVLGSVLKITTIIVLGGYLQPLTPITMYATCERMQLILIKIKKQWEINTSLQRMCQAPHKHGKPRQLVRSDVARQTQQHPGVLLTHSQLTPTSDLVLTQPPTNSS